MKTDNPRNPRSGRLAIVDVIAMITIALGVGLAASIVLGGTVLLFTGAGDNVISDAATLHLASLSRP